MRNTGLYIVSCPIGNPEDITLRALSVLKEADVIAAEDTRVTGQLLKAHGIKASRRLLSFHEHNEEKRGEELLERLHRGETVALVSDAGTPSVSDPGFDLVRRAIDGDINVVPVPGASAAITALSVSGLPTDAFLFAGFLPKKKASRRQRLEELGGITATLVFYESPRRILRSLADIRGAWGDRRAMVAREMTKPYEELVRGRVSDIARQLEQQSSIKGEITLVVAGAGEDPLTVDWDEIAKAALASEESTASLARRLSASYGLPRRQVYSRIVEIRNGRGGNAENDG